MPDGVRVGGTTIRVSPPRIPDRSTSSMQQALPTPGPVSIIRVTAGNSPASGAAVRIDGQPVGNVPMSHEVEPGRHMVQVGREGYVTFTQWVDVSGGQVLVMPVPLERQAPPVEVDHGWGGTTPCEPGLVSNEDTSGRCCWPNQYWQPSPGRCAGTPRCPDGQVGLPNGDCGCAPGQERSENTRGHCCWPGQVWVPSRNACVGRPANCPTGTQVVGEACARPTAPPIAAVTTTAPGQTASQPRACPPGHVLEDETCVSPGEQRARRAWEERRELELRSIAVRSDIFGMDHMSPCEDRAFGVEMSCRDRCRDYRCEDSCRDRFESAVDRCRSAAQRAARRFCEREYEAWRRREPPPAGYVPDRQDARCYEGEFFAD